jgi:hypothetical protein
MVFTWSFIRDHHVSEMREERVLRSQSPTRFQTNTSFIHSQNTTEERALLFKKEQ